MQLAKPILVAAALAAAFALAPLASAERNGRAAQAATVVVIDYTRIVEATDIGRDMTAKLGQIGQQMQGELQPDRAAIEAEQQSIQQATQGMSPEQVRANRALTSRIEAFSQRVEQFRTRQQSMGRDLEYTRQMTLNDFNQQITPVVREVMEARGAGIAMDASTVQLTLPAFNATDEVVTALNQRLHTMNVTRQSAPAPQQPPAPQQ